MSATVKNRITMNDVSFKNFIASHPDFDLAEI